MSGMKKKLMATVFMLVVSVLMLTTASYAWFTISTNPEIANMTTQVVVNENLEVALASTLGDPVTIPIAAALNDSGNQYTWGNVIDLSDTDLSGEATKPYFDLVKTLRPATLDGTAFKYPTYGADGRINVASGALVALTDSAMANGFGNLLGDAKVYGYYIDLWVRSNVGGDLKLTSAVKRSSAATLLDTSGSYFLSDGTNAAANDLAKNIRIAFKDITPSGVTGATAAVGAAPVAVKADDPTSASGKYKTLFSNDTGTKIVTLTANNAKLIRMYVYLEGAAVTNASASIDGAATSGILNIQFAIGDVGNSMDGQN